jgi:Holliday junction resolvase RusA-like endonuclease
MLDVFLPCVPPTANHQRKRIVRVGQFARLADKPELVAAKAMIDALLMAHRPPAAFRGHVSLTLEYTWPWRAADSNRRRALGRVRKNTKPDCSNLAKTTEDRLVALCFLEDDAQVSELHVRKFYGDRPGIRVVLQSISEAP